MCYDAFEEALLDFHHENKAKHCRIFAVEIWASIPNALGKHHLGPHPFRNQTSKPNTFKASKANANSSFSIANVLKL